MTTPLHRPVCDLLGCRYFLVLACMGGGARADLVTAVSRAGSVGFLGMVREPVDRIRADAEAHYMGQAERADARVSLHTARDAPADLAPLVRAIQHDEARWCALLTQSIQRLGGTPSRRTGDFHEKAMAIEDLPARLAFLNRGQRWVVRKLQALLPRVGDAQLQAGLGAMLAAHEANIAHVVAALDG